MTNEKVFAMSFAKVYPMLIAKAEWKGRNLIQFAASQKHIGLYPGPEAVEAFADRLASFPTSKGTIRLPLNQPMPLELIADIARWCEAAYGK